MAESRIDVRTAEAADIAEAVAAYRAARADAFTGLIPDEAVLPRTRDGDVARWAGFADDLDGRLLIADLRGTVIGLAAVENLGGQAELGALYVHPAHQRSGAGTALLSASADQARARGHATMTTWVLATNQAAKRFFLARGGWLDGGVEIRQAGEAKLTMQRLRFNVGA